MCARVSSKKRGKRDQRWYLSSLCISITCPPASLLLSLHLSPLFPQLSQENYNLTAHFNISASKWVWQPLLCVPPHPHLTASSVPTSIHPPTHPALSLPAPASSCHLLIIPPTVQLLPCDRRETDRDGKKQKQIRLKPRSLCQAIRLSLSVSLWVLWHVHDHEPTMRRGIASRWCMPLMVRHRHTGSIS